METIQFKPRWLVLRLANGEWGLGPILYDTLVEAEEVAAGIYGEYETRIIRVDSATFTEEQDAQATPDV